ncbi:MAG: hypothetical protein AAF367_17535 [Pseudomonadota bacterium]
MRIGAGISGGAHVVLIGLVVFSGQLFSEGQADPVTISEVTLMTGTEFEAATSAAPDFNPDLPSSPVAPNEAEEQVDVKLAEEDAAPTTREVATEPDAPETGEAVITPPEPVARADIADVGDQPAAPLAPEDDVIVRESEPTEEIAPVAEAVVAAASPPAARPNAPSIDTSTPEPVEETRPEPEPEIVEVKPEPEPEPEVEPQLEPEPEEPEVVKLNDPDIPAPKLAPPPPRKPRDVAEAKMAERLAREASQVEETGATQQAEAPASTGSSQSVGQLSFRDRDALRIGIKNYFSPPRGLPNEDQLAVKIQIDVSPDGRITGGPTVLSPGGRLDAAHGALMRAGVRALKKSEAAGVFSKLPADKYARWKKINVTFTPREIRFL